MLVALASGGSLTVESSASTPVKVQRVEVNDASIAYYTHGSGPPLVMLIGSHSTMSEWDPALIAELAKRRTVYMFDYRGVGLSGGKAGGSPTIAGMADNVAAFIKALALSKTDILGWSMGGMVAQQLTIRHPTTVRKLVLAGTNPGGRHAVLGPTRYIEIEDDPNASEAKQLETLFVADRTGKKAARDFLDRVTRAAKSDEIPDDFVVSDTAYRVQTEAESYWLKTNRNYVDLASIQAPTLVTSGTHDVLTPLINSKRITGRIPGAKLEIYKRGGHAFLFQFSHAFAETVHRFLDT